MKSLEQIVQRPHDTLNNSADLIEIGVSAQ